METNEQAARAVAHFYLRPVLDEEATKEAGRPIHKDAEYLRITIPGDRTSEVDRPVRGHDKQRFLRQYEAFTINKRGAEQFIGTPLSAWAQISEATIADYRHEKVRTVEDLAGLSDSAVQRMGRGTLKHRQMARDFIEGAKSAAPLLRVQSELETRDAQIAALQNALKEQSDKIDVLISARSAPIEELAMPIPEAESQSMKAGKKSAQAK